MFKIIPLFIITLSSRLYTRLGILLQCGNHKNHRIISLNLFNPPVLLKFQYEARKVSCHVFVSYGYQFLNCSDSVVIFVANFIPSPSHEMNIGSCHPSYDVNNCFITPKLYLGACLKIFIKYIWSEFYFNALPKRFDSISLSCSLIVWNVLFWIKQNKMISDTKIQIRDQIWRYQALTRRVSLVEQELLTLLEHLTSLPGI